MLEDWTSDPLPLYVMYPPSRHLSPRVRVFADWLAALFERLGLAPAGESQSEPIDRLQSLDPLAS